MSRKPWKDALGLVCLSDADASSGEGVLAAPLTAASPGPRASRWAGVPDAVWCLSAGASHQSKTWMTPLSKYSGLFAQGGKLDFPP